MAYLGAGFITGIFAAALAYLSGAGVVIMALAYVGGGSAVMLAALASAMMFEQSPDKAEDNAMLFSNR